MTKHQYINEDKRPQKLSVGFSTKLSERINNIYSCNQDNVDKLSLQNTVSEEELFYPILN